MLAELLLIIADLRSALANLEFVPSQDPTQGLVAYYPFNDNADDKSGNGNHGTVYGATLTTDRFGQANSAYYFDGIKAHIKLNNSEYFDLTDTLSFVAWVKLENLDKKMQPIISKTESGAYSLYYNHTGMDNRFASFQHIGGSYKNAITTTIAKKNTWYHIVATYDGRNISIYVNGVLEHQVTQTGKLKSTKEPVMIGADPDNGKPQSNWFFVRVNASKSKSKPHI